eukprot:jgi/Chrzof1/6082/Cz17g09020.t1
MCVSEKEGFGHYLNEARAVAALVITTDHPPMNELVTASTGILVSVESTWNYPHPPSALKQYADLTAAVSWQHICHGLDAALNMTTEQRAEKGRLVRQAFLQERFAFYARLNMVKDELYRICRLRILDSVKLLLGMPHPTSENLPSKIYISPQSPSGSTHLPGPPSVPLPPTLIQVICLSGFRWYVSHPPPPPPRRAHPNSLGRGHTSEPSRAVIVTDSPPQSGPYSTVQPPPPHWVPVRCRRVLPGSAGFLAAS